MRDGHSFSKVTKKIHPSSLAQLSYGKRWGKLNLPICCWGWQHAVMMLNLHFEVQLLDIVVSAGRRLLYHCQFSFMPLLQLGKGGLTYTSGSFCTSCATPVFTSLCGLLSIYTCSSSLASSLAVLLCFLVFPLYCFIISLCTLTLCWTFRCSMHTKMTPGVECNCNICLYLAVLTSYKLS